MPGWRKWQTRMVEGHVDALVHGGSNPPPGIKRKQGTFLLYDNLIIRITFKRLEFKGGDSSGWKREVSL